MSLERKARDAELVAHRLLQETERRNREAFMYRSQFLGTEPSWPQVNRFILRDRLKKNFC